MSSSICLEFPGPYAGAVIGKAGSTLKGIQGASGATLQLSQPLAERYAPDGTPNPAFASSFRTLRVSATSIDSIHAACDRVVEVLRAEAARKGRRSGGGGSSGGGGRGDEAVTVVVPSSTARMLQATTDNRGAAATSIIGRIRASSGAAISAERRGGDTHDWRLVCSGGAAQAREAMRGLVEAAAGREAARHEDFLARNWPAFATDYSDHFETPRRAYEHIAPVLAAVARQQQQQQQQQQQHDEEEEVCQKRKRKRSRTEVEVQSPSSPSLAPSELLIYDPYYCQGRARALLASVMGYRESSVINANRDFYADVAAGAVPRHGVLVTNPPYSAEHKQRLLGFLLDQQRAWWEEEQRRRQRQQQRREAKEMKKKAKKGKKRRRREEDQGSEEQEKKSKKKEKKKRREEVAERENNDGEAGSDREGREDNQSLDAVVRPKPFLLLMPAWVAAGEFWRSFLRDLAALRKQGSQQPPHENEEEEEEEEEEEKEEGAALEREAGVFYVCPGVGGSGRGEAYQFDHAEGTQRGECPFFGAWFCGGWVDDGDRRRAMASLKAARRHREGAEGGKVEVFRSTATMRRRGHFDARGAVTQGLGTGMIAVASKKI